MSTEATDSGAAGAVTPADVAGRAQRLLPRVSAPEVFVVPLGGDLHIDGTPLSEQEIAECAVQMEIVVYDSGHRA